MGKPAIDYGAVLIHQKIKRGKAGHVDRIRPPTLRKPLIIPSGQPLFFKIDQIMMEINLKMRYRPFVIIFIIEVLMFIRKLLPFVEDYLNSLNDALTEYNPGIALSRIQKYWLGFCIMGILQSNQINWTGFARLSLGKYNKNAISWMFRHSKISWEHLFHISLGVVLHRYGIRKGILAIDDTDKKRSKSVKTIYGCHKVKDKSTGGFFMGQKLVFLALVTPKITIPAGFTFHRPDPALTKWFKENKRLKKKGIPAKERPKKPERSPSYPTIPALALKLLREFKEYHPEILIQAIVADALYGTGDFMDKASNMFNGIQVISQIRSNQKVKLKNQNLSVENYFKRNPVIDQKIQIRGGNEVPIDANSARIRVVAHKKKRFVIALKYNGESECRYLVATDMTWRTLDIIEAYTLRWLIEVFFQDHKANEGWGTLTKQPGKEGSYRSLTLSLLVDHSLFFHPDQLALLDNKMPANTVGNLCKTISVESLLALIKDILAVDDPVAQFENLSELMKEQFSDFKKSDKHMNARIWGNFQQSPSLKYKAAS